MINRMPYEELPWYDYVPIVWPSGRVDKALSRVSKGLNWAHLHQGHSKIITDCYSCACEEAY